MDKQDIAEKLKLAHIDMLKYLTSINLNYWPAFNSCNIKVTVPVVENMCTRYLEMKSEDISKQVKEVYPDWPDFKILKDLYTQVLAILIKISLEDKSLEHLSKQLYIIWAIRTHFSLVKKYWRYCDENAFHMAIENVPRQHLFQQKESIQKAFYYLIDELFERYKHEVAKEKSSVKIIRMLYDWRTRWEQSLRSLAHKFYEIKEGKIKIVSVQNKEFLIDDKIDRIIDSTINVFLMYKDFNQNLLKQISSKILLKTDYLEPFIKTLTIVDENRLKVILYTIVNNKSYNDFASKDTLDELVGRMSTRYTAERTSLKEQIHDFILYLCKLNSKAGVLFVKVSNPYKQKIRVGLVLFLYFTMIGHSMT